MRLSSIRRPVRRGIKDEKGQAAIELLLIFPVIILVVLMSVDFGVWMFESVSVANSVREGVRYAAVNCPTDSPPGCDVAKIQQWTSDHSSGSLDPADVHVSWVTRGSALAGTKGSSVVVQVCKSYSMIFAPVTFSSGLVSNADMRLEADSSSSAGGSTC